MKTTKVKIRKLINNLLKTQRMLILFTIKRVNLLDKDYKRQTLHFKNSKMLVLTKKITNYKFLRPFKSKNL